MERATAIRDGLSMTMMMLWALMLSANLHLVSGTSAKENSNLLKVEYKAPNLFPEGFHWDAEHARFLVGSMQHGKIVAVDKKGVVSEFVRDEEYATGATILGVTVDQARNRVLAVMRGSTGEKLAAGLVAYDLDSKKRRLYVTNLNEDDSQMSKPGVNDVTVDDDGNAYVTDSMRNSVWKVSPSGDKSVLLSSLPWQPVIAQAVPVVRNSDGEVQPAALELVKGSHANGIVYHNGYLVICQSSSGSLIRVRLSDNKVTVVSMKPEGALLPAADGLALRWDGSLIVVSFHTAWLVTSKDSWRTATVIEEVPLEKAGFTTSVTTSEEGIFTLQSNILESVAGLDREIFKIQEIEFPNDAYDNPLWLLVIVGMFAVLVLAWKFQMNQFNKGYNKKRV